MVKLIEGVPGVFLHYCPGCENYHYFHTTYPNRSNAQWAFNHNLDQPTFHPSMNVVGQCHYWLQEGRITYLNDSDHYLRNQTIPLPEFDENDPILHKWIRFLTSRVL